MARKPLITIDRFGNEIDLLDLRPRQEIINELMITKEEAAARAGISIDQFKALVRERIFPEHAPRSRLWQRKLLYLRLHGVSIHSEKAVAGYVYFMQMGDFIKIGWSTWPDNRRDGLQTSNPYDIIILGAFPGRTDQESKVHRLFKHLHWRGEWFRQSPGLWAYIAWQKVVWRGNADVISGDLDNVVKLASSGKSVESTK